MDHLLPVLDTLRDMGFGMTCDRCNCYGILYRTEYGIGQFIRIKAYFHSTEGFIIYEPNSTTVGCQYDDVIDIYSKYMQMSKL